MPSPLPPDRASLKSMLRSFIVAEFLPGESVDSLKDDTDLKATAILDSMSTIKLIAHLENTYGILIEPHEAASEFDTIENVAAVVERKR